VAAVDGLTGASIGDPAQLGSTFRLAYPGELVAIYATGFGLSTPPVATGQLANNAAQVSNVAVVVDGVAVDASAVQYAGVVPGAAGLYQVNLLLPANLPSGDHSVVLIVNSISSPPTAYISVGMGK
jgi:uncharacterized protein (TIGR03437 family)